MLLFGQNLLVMIFIGQFRPMIDRKSNNLEVFNEFIIGWCTIIFFAFTQFVSNPFTKYEAGWFSVSFVSILVLVNVLMMIATTCIGLNIYRKKYYDLLKMKKENFVI